MQIVAIFNAKQSMSYVPPDVAVRDSVRSVNLFGMPGEDVQHVCGSCMLLKDVCVCPGAPHRAQIIRGEHLDFWYLNLFLVLLTF